MDTLAKLPPLSAKVHGHALVSDEWAVVELRFFATATEYSISLTTLHLSKLDGAARAKKP